MSSISIEVADLQSGIVSGAGNVIGIRLDDTSHVPASEAQVGAEGAGFKEEGLDREGVDTMVNESGSKTVLIDSEVMADREGGDSVEANTGFEEKGLETEGDSTGMEVDFAKESSSRAILMRVSHNVDASSGISVDNGGGVELKSLEIEGDSIGMEVDFDKGSVSSAVMMDSELMVDREVGATVSHNEEPNNNSNGCGVIEESDGFGGNLKGLSNDELLPYAKKSDNEVTVRVSLDENSGKDGENVKKRKEKFRGSDLVWGKVRSHPWWPGQIVEPGDASDKARKCVKKPVSYLVAYFGDQTFAWNDKAKLKPFVPHFSQMVKQTNMEAFREAVTCALDEVSRRVEFGLSCSCISDDVYSELETQVIKNSGIKEHRISHKGIERSFAMSLFEPQGVLDYIFNLAVGPRHTEVDKLQLAMTRSQISAFYRWKGIYHLAEFGTLLGYVNNEADAPVTEIKEEIPKLTIDHEKVDEGSLQEHKPKKRKKISSENFRQTKKEKCLSDIIPKKSSSKGKSEGKTDKKAISYSSSTKKEPKVSPNRSKTESRGVESLETSTLMESKKSKPSFSVGESILRVASQLSKPSPLLKLDVPSHGKTTKGSKEAGQQTKELSCPGE